RGLQPSVEQRVFTREDRTNLLLPIVSGPSRDGDAVLVHQDAAVYVSSVAQGARLEHAFAPDQGAYLYVIQGEVDVNGERLGTGSHRVGGAPAKRSCPA